MKKLLVVLCCLLLVCSTALGEGMFEGKWEDRVSQRAWMRIDRNWSGNYDVRVFWGSGIFEQNEWYMTAVYDPTVSQLAYNNGSSYTVYYDGNGNVTTSQVNYENKSGLIWFDGDGYLRFLSTDNSLNGCKFTWNGY